MISGLKKGYGTTITGVRARWTALASAASMSSSTTASVSKAVSHPAVTTSSLSCRNTIAMRGFSSSSSSSMSWWKAKEQYKQSIHKYSEVDKIARSVGVRLTPNELKVLKQKLEIETCTQEEITRRVDTLAQDAVRQKATREICLSVVLSQINNLDKVGVKILQVLDYVGTALFAVVGSQIAGDYSGMNIVGCTLVGCTAALGGGSVNAVLFGGASPSLLSLNPGVRWVANPSYLVVAFIASIGTFFAWPYYCKLSAEEYLSHIFGKGNDDNGDDDDKHTTTTTVTSTTTPTAISEDLFLQVWKSNPSFRKMIRDAMPEFSVNINNKESGSIIDKEHDNTALKCFHSFDKNEHGKINVNELTKLITNQRSSPTAGVETYVLETLGLCSLSIAAVGSSIRLGLHPIVAAASGVTACFGGILRDILCGRDLAIGSQSYALATGASSTVYVLLRELCIRRILVLPLALRTFIAASTCISIRASEYHLGQPLLRPMHDYDENYVTKQIRR